MIGCLDAFARGAIHGFGIGFVIQTSQLRLTRLLEPLLLLQKNALKVHELNICLCTSGTWGIVLADLSAPDGLSSATLLVDRFLKHVGWSCLCVTKVTFLSC